METKEYDSKPACKWAWFAKRDAQFRSAINKTKFSDATHLKVDQMKTVLREIYSYTAVTSDPQIKFVRIKVHNGIPKNAKVVREWEAYWAEQGIVKRKTNQGIIYRIKEVKEKLKNAA